MALSERAAIPPAASWRRAITLASSRVAAWRRARRPEGMAPIPFPPCELPVRGRSERRDARQRRSYDTTFMRAYNKSEGILTRARRRCILSALDHLTIVIISNSLKGCGDGDQGDAACGADDDGD